MKKFKIFLAALVALVATASITFSIVGVPVLVQSTNGSFKPKATLTSAATSVDTENKTIYVLGYTPLSESLVVPTTRAIKVVFAGYIDTGSSYSLTINGPFEAGLHKVFSGGGNVSFGAGAVKEVFAEWWGVTGTADQVPIQKAMDCAARSAGYGVVQLLAKVYHLASQLSWPEASPVILNGTGIESTTLSHDGRDDCVNGNGTNILKSQIRNLAIFGNRTTSNVGIRLTHATVFGIHNVRVYGFRSGLILKNSNGVKLDEVHEDTCRDGLTLLQDANQITVIGSEFYNNSGYGIYAAGSKSVNIFSSAIESSLYGVYITADTTNQSTRSFNLIGNYIEGNSKAEVMVTRESGSVSPGGIQIRNNYFGPLVGKASIATRINYSNGVNIDGNIYDNQATTYIYALYLSDSTAALGVVYGNNTDSSTSGVLKGTGQYYTNTSVLTPKAWGRFNVSGGAIVNDATLKQFGVSGIVYISAGIYEVTLDHAMSSSSYNVQTTAEKSNTTSALFNFAIPISSTVFRIYTATDSTTAADARSVNFSVFSY